MLAALEERIRRAFPALAFAHAELNTYGEDNYVVVLDGAWIVRLPRSDDQIGRFAAELILLEHLRTRVPIAVPHYTFVAPDRSIGAYRMIEGREMTPPVFMSLDRTAQAAVLTALGGFLATLHALPPETIVQPDGSVQRCWTGAQFAAYYRGVRRAMIAPRVSEAWLARFDAFHDALAEMSGGVPRLAHNDLSDDHILLAAGGTLAGVIDFTDASWGDPANDFAYVWRLGEPAVDRLFACYPLAAEDPDLKRRSHWMFLRYLINQISYGERAKWNLNVDEALAELEPHLRKQGL
jgi:aminoglycoside phosphotransferase (APT) family kinase protein